MGLLTRRVILRAAPAAAARLRQPPPTPTSPGFPCPQPSSPLLPWSKFPTKSSSPLPPLLPSSHGHRVVGEAERAVPPHGAAAPRPGHGAALVVGLHGPQDVPTLSFLMVALRWGGGNGELAEMCKLIGEALDAYQADCGDGVKVRRLLALSSFLDMHSDICICAEDAMAALVLLPFHKSQCLDGSMDAGHFGFRLVNQKVLQLAPCSVGIMVDRGLGKQSGGRRSSMSDVPQSAVVVFIGGADDREALMLASFMCKHPGVRLTALRIVQNATAQARAKARTSLFESKSRRNIQPESVLGEEELQMQVDDKFFAEFYRKYVAGNKAVGYLEKHVADGAELVSVLRGMQGEYRLFVVGRGRDRNSVLTEGLEEWAECLELGPVGDILASSDFSTTASVLIVQQYDAKKHYKVIDEEFMPL